MFIADLLFPKFCLGCRKPGSYICHHCRRRLKYLEKRTCFYCQKKSPLGLTHPICLKKLNVDGVYAIFYYNSFLKKIIKNIKYRLAIEIFKELKLSIEPDFLNKLSLFKKVVGKAHLQSIPLTSKKLKSRGFNQAFFIASYFQSYLGLPISDYLIRKNEREPQAQLKSSKKRYQNVRGVFTLRPNIDISHKKIVLVDDVVTTGSTIKEAARILKKAGAEKVYVLALAKG